VLENAVLYSPRWEEIEVSVCPNGSITVADRGPGIPICDREHVFERFWRGTGSALKVPDSVCRSPKTSWQGMVDRYWSMITRRAGLSLCCHSACTGLEGFLSFNPWGLSSVRLAVPKPDRPIASLADRE